MVRAANFRKSILLMDNFSHNILDIPLQWHKRLEFYSRKLHASASDNDSVNDNDRITISSSKFGPFIYSSEREKHAKNDKKLICYYTTPKFVSSNGRRRRRSANEDENLLRIRDINPQLCTHLHIGIIDIENCTLQLDDDLINAFRDGNELKKKNDRLKLLLWVSVANLHKLRARNNFPSLI
jgi:hypothetical protein